jgi:hypothetical protein
VLIVNCGDDSAPPIEEEQPDAATREGRSVSLRVLPAHETYADKTLTEWAVEYMRWVYSSTLNDCTSAESDADGSLCALHQNPDSPVFFLASCNYAEGRGVVVDRAICKVPAGKALLVPISALSDEQATNDEPLTAEALRVSTSDVLASMREQRLVVDGTEITEFAPYSIGPVAFAFEIPPQPNWHTCNGYDELENQHVDPSYLVGYFALIEAPAAGKHKIEYASIYTYWNNDYYFHVKSTFIVE